MTQRSAMDPGRRGLATATLLALAGLLAGCLDGGVGPSGSIADYEVFIQDIPGDALFDERVPTSPDLLSVVVAIKNDTFSVSAEYVPGVDLPSTYLAVSIDADGSLITGEGVDGHGVDFVVAVGAGVGGATNVAVLRYNGFGYFPTAVPVPLVLTATGIMAKVPLPYLGGLDGGGFMTVRASTHHRLPTEWTPVLDFAPDEEIPPVVLN